MKRSCFFIVLSAALICGEMCHAQSTTIEVNTFPEEKKDTVIDREKTTQDDRIDTIRIGNFSIIQCKSCDDSEKHPTRVIFGAKKPRKKLLKDVDVNWWGFELGWNNFTDRSAYGTAEVTDFALSKPGEPETAAGEFSLRTGKSVNVNIWPIWVRVSLVNHYLSLKTGFGVEMNNYRYSKSISYVNDVSKTYIIRDSVNFKKNKLFTEYLTIPLLLNVETNPYHSSGSFRVSIGPTFGYLIKSRTKQISEERGKVKNKDAFNLEKFRLGMRGEIGFGPVTLYSDYSFTPIHQYGLKQYPFSIGIVLIGSKNW